MDPLIYSGIKNTLATDKTLKLKKSLTGVTTNEQLDQLLDETTIKRGCCMRKKKGDKILVKVKIPRPKDVPIEVKDSVEERFNYIEKLVDVDPKYCDDKYNYFQPASNECDDFYKSYCENMRADYEEMVGDKFSSVEWNDYSPDCACYGQKAEESAPGVFTGVNVPPKCYMPDCGGSTAYLDPTSRAGECNLTICNALFNASDFAAGKNISVQSKVEQNCGKNTTKTTTPVTPETTTPETTTETTTTTVPQVVIPPGTKSGDTNKPVESTKPTDKTTTTDQTTIDQTTGKSNMGLYLGIGGGLVTLVVIGFIVYKMKSKK